LDKCTIQAYSARLTDIAALTPSDGNFIVGNGTTWVAESGNTARTSLGLGSGDSPTLTGLTLSGLTTSRVITTDGSKGLTSSATTAIEVGYVSGVTSPIQTQLDGKQPLDATLTSLSALGTTADRIAYTTGVDTWAETPLTAAARTVLDDTTVANMVNTLGGASSTGTGGLVRATAPTFATSITTPLIIGGTAVGSNLVLKSTTGNGSSDYISLVGGNNGASEFARFGRDLITLKTVGTTRFEIDLDGNLNIDGINNVAGNQVLATDSSGYVVSLAYSQLDTPESLVFRDSSGNFDAGTVTLTALGIGLTPTCPLDVLESTGPTSLTGTVSTTSGGNTLNGSSTLFTTELKVGDVIRIGTSSKRVVTAIASDTSLTVGGTFSATVSGQTLTKESLSQRWSSATSVNLLLEADTNNTTELDNPRIRFLQDNRNFGGSIGLAADAGIMYDNVTANAFIVMQEIGSANLQLGAGCTVTQTITPGGIVGIGTNAPDTLSKLHVRTSGVGGDYGLFINNFAGGAGWGLTMQPSTAGDMQYIRFNKSDGTQMSYIGTSGSQTKLTVGSVLDVLTEVICPLFTTTAGASTGTSLIIDASNHIRPLTSSERFKKNIRPYSINTSGLDLLKIISFNYRETGDYDISLSAEQAAEVMPFVVNYDKEGKPYSINFPHLTLALLESYRKLKQQITLTKPNFDL
jgi:hypothetical protein